MIRRSGVVRCATVMAALAFALAGATAVPAHAAVQAPTNFVVLGPASGGLDRTTASVSAAGGRVLQSWPQIGIVVVESDRSDFATRLRGAPGVVEVGASRAGAAKQTQELPTQAAVPGPLGPGTSGGDDTDEADFDKQWDMELIGADRAHQVTDGSRDVTVGVLDSGIDAGHPDLRANVDASQSVSCVSDGVPDTRPAAWQPTNSSHGTHVAGTIAAARNGIGIIGVAPGVKLASVKVVDDQGYIYPEYAICGFVWAAERGMDVTNNSYFIDPWGLWCATDPDQRAVLSAVSRALAYAGRKDVVTVAAAGNSRWDLSGPITDTGSPNNGTPIERRTDNRCYDIPTESPDVIAVSAVGPTAEKAYYSNYGNRSVDITAPGGDAWLDWQAERSRQTDTIYSTIPGGGYGWSQGTSMAAPHVAGVVALMRSTHPDWSAGQVRRMLSRQAIAMSCPEVYDYTDDGVADATCEGAGGAGFYGAGLVDANAAVTENL